MYAPFSAELKSKVRMKIFFCSFPEPSGPKKITVGFVIFTFPFLTLVSQKVIAEIAKAIIDIIKDRYCIIQSFLVATNGSMAAYRDV